MAKNNSKEIEWKEVIETAADISGAPKKQIETDAEAIDKAIRKTLTEKQPKRDGDELKIFTPFGVYCSTRIPEAVVVDNNGNRMTRPSVCAVNIGIPRDYIDVANIGLVDKDASEDKKDSKAS